MKKVFKVIIIIIVLGLVFLVVSWLMKYDDYESLSEGNMVAKLNAVVMEVYDNALGVMGIEESDNSDDLYIVSFAEEGNIGFDEGQEICIYFDGIVAESFPAQISNVGKIEIVKEKSEVMIPDDVLRYYNNTKDKVDVEVSELTNIGITITITDKNELPYEYFKDYEISKEIKNEDYTGEGEKIGKDTDNSTSGFTGTGSEYIWEPVEKKSEISTEKTIKDLIYNLPNNTKGNIICKKIDWTEIYGKLTDGKYRLTFLSGSFPIVVEFLIEGEKTELLDINYGM